MSVPTPPSIVSLPKVFVPVKFVGRGLPAISKPLLIVSTAFTVYEPAPPAPLIIAVMTVPTGIPVPEMTVPTAKTPAVTAVTVRVVLPLM